MMVLFITPTIKKLIYSDVGSLITFAIVIQLQTVEAIRICHDCTAAQRIEDCQNRTFCRLYEKCSVSVRTSTPGGQMQYDLGCMPETQCPDQESTPGITRRLILEQPTLVCRSCCTDSLCNNKSCVNGVTTCPDKWIPFHGHCYLFCHNQTQNYSEAKQYCQQHEAHVVHVDDHQESEFLKEYMSTLKDHFYWIGITDELIEGDWVWSDTGIAAVFTDWLPGEPASAGGTFDEDCAVAIPHDGYRWEDTRCSKTYQPVCERTQIAGKKTI